MKKYQIFKSIIVVYLFLTAFLLQGSTDKQKKDKVKVEPPVENPVTKSTKRTILSPIIFYSPETKLAFGGVGSYIFRLSKKNDSTRPSNISPLAIYTLNKQFKLQVKSEMFFKKNSYRLLSFINTQKYPDKFYGIGNNTVESAEEDYSSRSSTILISLQKQLLPNFSFGLQYHFNHWSITEKETGGQLENPTLLGSEGGNISGIGLILTHDTRDNVFSATRGNLVEINFKRYFKFLGSDFSYSDLSIDVRYFFPVFKRHVIAFQGKMQTQSGDVPFVSMAKMGGEFNMRGYFFGRYRDKNLLLFQGEYRMPLFWKLGIVGFAGVGSVADQLKNLTQNPMKLSYGFGLRFLFDRKENIVLRFDFGFGENGSSFYFSAFEAF